MLLSAPLVDALSRLIWQLTLLLVLVALLVVLMLVLRRLLEELRREALARRQAHARRLLLERLRDPAAAPGVPDLPELPADYLIELVDELAQMVRGEGRERLAALGERLGLRDRLLQSLRAWRPGLRVEAARRLAIYRGDRVVRALCRALFDRAPQVRLAAATALLDQDGLPVDLLHHARHDPAFSRPGAIGFWQRLAETRPDAFLRLFEEPSPAARRVPMLRAAGVAGLTRLAERMIADTAAPEPAVRRAAVMALLDLKHPLALDALARLLADPDPRLRADAVVAVGRRRLLALLGMVRDRLDDPDPAVRFRAGEAVLRLGQGGGARAGGRSGP